MVKILTKRNIALASVLVLVLLLMVIIGLKGMGVIAFGEKGASEYQTNKNGLTYGSLADQNTYGGPPDLVMVALDDDTIGYVYYSDLEAAESAGVSTPEEAVEHANNMEAQSEQVFQEELNKSLGQTVINSEAEAREYLDMIDEGLNNEVSKDIAPKVSVEKSTLDDLILEAYDRATERISTSIPVYDENGKDIIGEFSVGGLS